MSEQFSNPQIQLSMAFVRHGAGESAVFYRAQSSGRPSRNNLKFLGQIETDEGNPDFTPAQAGTNEDQNELADWANAQYAELIKDENAPSLGTQTHHPADGEEGIYTPWYAIFTYQPDEHSPEDMWIARFEKDSPTSRAYNSSTEEEAADSVYMTIPNDENTPIFNGTHVVMRLFNSARSVVFPTQQSAGEHGNGGSSGHGGTEDRPKIDWE